PGQGAGGWCPWKSGQPPLAQDAGHCLRRQTAGTAAQTDCSDQKAINAQHRADASARIPIQGKFWLCMGAYGLTNIAALRADSSEAWIRSIFLVMNLIKLARLLFWLGFGRLFLAWVPSYTVRPAILDYATPDGEYFW